MARDCVDCAYVWIDWMSGFLVTFVVATHIAFVVCGRWQP